MSKSKHKKSSFPFISNTKGVTISLLLFLGAALTLSVLNTEMFHPQDGFAIETGLFYRYRCYRIVDVICLLFSIIGVLYWGIIKSEIQEYFKNISLLFISFFALLLVAEIPFSFINESDAIGGTWAHILWERKYWDPKQVTLPDGYFMRLRNDGNEIDRSKKVICNVGDSFSCGDGLDSASYSYPSCLREKIEQLYPNQYSLVNLGERGADSYREFNNYFAYFIKASNINSEKKLSKPKLLIWQYYGNDVDNTARQFGLSLNVQTSPFENLIEWIFKEHFFVTDYLYWHFMKRNHEKEYNDFLRQCYSGELLKNADGTSGDIKTSHFYPINNAQAGCRVDSTKFLMVIFPYMNNISFAESLYANEIEKVCLANNVSVINLCGIYKHYRTNQLVVSPRNPHPSILAHKIAADTIFKYIVNNRLLE